jgi:uncharacterized protein (TIGR02217 family)
MSSTIVIDETHLPDSIEKGMTGGPNFNTTVYDGDAGRTVTNQNWSQARGIWHITYGYMEKDDYRDLIAFFRARGGKARGFLFKDWTDFEIPRQVIGTADGVVTDFPIFKTYEDDVNDTTRRIYRPVEDTILIWVNGSTSTAFDLVDPGIIHFHSAPVSGDIEIECEFDIPAQFQADGLNLSVAWQNAVAMNDMPVMELRE